MSLFNFFKKKPANRVVWRNEQGALSCPGDKCPKECDNSCPVYLNTQAAALMSIGERDKAVPLYNKILEIAPDYYDAWNNLAGIYGGKGDYKKAYDHFLKAHEIHPQRPNPVFGLMLASRDLQRYEECIKWCDLYRTLSNDGRDIPVRNVANAALGRGSVIDERARRF